MPELQEDHQRWKDLNFCVVIATYNNDQTLAQVIRDVLKYTEDIIVVNDGSTDSTGEILEGFPQIRVIGIPVNTGKGHALRKGFEAARKAGFRYAITLDSDAQHKASDIPKFLSLVSANPDTLIVGARNMHEPSVPGSSRFGHKFSVFWFWIETGMKIADVQTGFRLYPLEKISHIHHFYTKKYEFEVEVLVRLAWRGTDILSVPIDVYYPPKGSRVTHFRKGRDFTRASLLNAILVVAGLLWIRPFMFIKGLKSKSFKGFIREYIINSGDSNARVTLSVMTGLYIGVLPVWGWQMMVAFGIAHMFRLNKFVTVAASNISIPPLLPLILYLSYITGGWVMGTGSDAIRYSAGIGLQWIKTNFVQYMVGSFIFGFILALSLGALTYILLAIFRKIPGKTEELLNE